MQPTTIEAVEVSSASIRAQAKAGCDFPRRGKNTLLGVYHAGQRIEQLPNALTMKQAMELNRMYKAKVCASIRALPVPGYLKKYPTAVFTPASAPRFV